MFRFWVTVVLVVLITIGDSIESGALHSTNITLRKQIPADRTYYIACVEIDWDYAPNATNPFTGTPVAEELRNHVGYHANKRSNRIFWQHFGNISQPQQQKTNIMHGLTENITLLFLRMPN